MEKKKLLLVFPKYFAVCASDVHYIRDLTIKGGYINCNLATLAALTPPEFDVKIVDENVEPLDLEEPCDLVGIGGYPTQLSRAREIAQAFSKNGVLVVCGGPSASLNPKTWKKFCDVIIIGEAERIWPQFLKDYLSGTYQSEYREFEKPDLSISPLPDYSAQSKQALSKYLIGVVQCSRGCPFDCEFCNVIVYVGRKMRYKSVEQIMREIEQQADMGFKYVFLADDNFPAKRSASKAILKAIRDWNRTRRYPIKFFTQLSIDISKDDEFLELAAEAGLFAAFIGLETPNVESLLETRKYQNVRTDLLEGVKKFHEHGLMVGSGSIVGFDHDRLNTFQQQFDFFTAAGIPQIAVFPLQAAEGTPLKARMIEEGRYIGREAGFDSMISAVSIVPKNMTVEQLQQGVYWLLSKYYDWDNYTDRVRIFFENYEGSSKKKRLRIPKRPMDAESVACLWKVFRHLVLESTPAERRALWKMGRCALKSTHPNRFFIVVSSFISAFNMRKTVLRVNEKFEEAMNPAVSEGSYIGRRLPMTKAPMS